MRRPQSPTFARLRFLAGLALALVPAAARAGAFPFPVTQETLPNGLRVLFVPMDAPGLVAYYTAVRTGSRDEIEKGHTGFAHFFEHMMFRGTKANPNFDARMAEFGWSNNAFTSDDQTVYTDFGPTVRLPDIIALEADRFQNLQYAEPAFRTEALAVLGEYNKSAAGPWLLLEETLAKTAFTKHTYQHTTLGYLEDIKSMPGKYAYSKRFHQRFYRPDNCIVMVVGDFDRTSVLSEIQKHYGAWKGRAERPKIPVEPPQTSERRAALTWAQPTLPRLLMGYKMPSASDRKTEAGLDVMYAYLFGETGVLYKSLVLERQIAEPFDAWSRAHRDPGLWAVLATGKTPEALPEIEKAIDVALADVRAGKIDAAQLAAIRSNRRYGLILGLEDPDAVASLLAWTISITGDLDAVERYMTALDALTAADLQALATTLLQPAGRTVVTLVHAAPPAPAAPVAPGKGP